jgi:hypothetical protein
VLFVCMVSLPALRIKPRSEAPFLAGPSSLTTNIEIGSMDRPYGIQPSGSRNDSTRGHANAVRAQRRASVSRPAHAIEFTRMVEQLGAVQAARPNRATDAAARTSPLLIVLDASSEFAARHRASNLS